MSLAERSPHSCLTAARELSQLAKRPTSLLILLGHELTQSFALLGGLTACGRGPRELGEDLEHWPAGVGHQGKVARHRSTASRV